MAKEAFYFSHDYNTRVDVKIKKLIKKLGFEGYGLFWAIVEDLYNNENALPADYEGIAYELRVDEELIKSVINEYDLFIIENNIISSESVARRLELRDAKTDKAREAAKQRWKNKGKKGKKDANAYADALPTDECSNAIKESIVNESKEKESKIINEKIISIKNAFIENDFENTLQLFQDKFVTEKTLNDALKDYCIILGTSNGSIPSNFIIFRGWFREFLNKNVKSYQEIPKQKYKIICPDFYTIYQLYNMFKIKSDPEHQKMDLIERINNGEFEPIENSDGLIFGVQRGSIEIV